MFAIAVSPYHKTITGQDDVHQCGELWCPPLLLENRLFYILHSQVTDRLEHSNTNIVYNNGVNHTGKLVDSTLSLDFHCFTKNNEPCS